MAERTGTLDLTGRETAPSGQGPETTDTGTTVVVPAGGEPRVATATSEPDILQRELEDLRRQNDRYKQQLQGWESQSLRNRAERDAVQQRLDQIERSLQNPPHQTSPPTQPAAPHLDVEGRLNRWLNNDASAARELEASIIAELERRTGQAASRMDPREVEHIVNQRIATIMTNAQAQTLVYNRHPELQRVDDPVSREVYENYEAYAADPSIRMLFGDDPLKMVERAGFDGSSKTMDLRVMNEAANRIKMARGVQQGRQEEREASTIGTAQNSTGTNSTSRRQTQVEAVQLLTEKQTREIDNMIAQHSIPSGWPKTREGIAKKFYDLATPEERDQMHERHRVSARSTV